MSEVHWSDCALHSLPARWPGPCDCGKAKADIQSAKASCRPFGILAARLQIFRQLWQARIAYLHENLGSLAHYRQIAAKRIGLNRRRYRSQEHEAPRS